MSFFSCLGGNNHHNFQTVQNINVAVLSGQWWSGRPFQDCFVCDENYGGQEGPENYDYSGRECRILFELEYGAIKILLSNWNTLFSRGRQRSKSYEKYN